MSAPAAPAHGGYPGQVRTRRGVTVQFPLMSITRDFYRRVLGLGLPEIPFDPPHGGYPDVPRPDFMLRTCGVECNCPRLYGDCFIRCQRGE